MEIILIFFLILLNGFFAFSEIAIISSKKSRLKQYADEGKRGSRLAYNISLKPSFFLSTVQICITFIGIMIGAIGEGSIVNNLASFLSGIPVLNSVHEQLSFIIFLFLVTSFSIIFGELVPKRIALSNPEKYARIVSPVMKVFSEIFNPVVMLLAYITENIFRLVGFKRKIEPSVTEEEIRLLIREGTDIGIFNKTEKKLVERALLLDDLKVNMLMTPRNKIEWFDWDRFLSDPHEHLLNYHHSRVLFGKKDVDNIFGIIHVKDLLKFFLLEKQMDIKNKLSKPLLVPDNTKALKILEIFRHSSIHLALVVDEYGSVLGLITLNDILEALVGDIKTQQIHDPMIVKRQDNSYLLDGMLPVTELKKLLKTDKLPREDTGEYQTAGGFVMSYMENYPKTGDIFTWQDFRFEIMDMDEKRVDRILISRIK